MDPKCRLSGSASGAPQKGRSKVERSRGSIAEALPPSLTPSHTHTHHEDRTWWIEQFHLVPPTRKWSFQSWNLAKYSAA